MFNTFPNKKKRSSIDLEALESNGLETSLWRQFKVSVPVMRLFR